MFTLTRPVKILIHLAITSLLLISIITIFAIILVDNINYANHRHTLCNVINVTKSNYICCSQICNTTLPQCGNLLNNNTPGHCCTSSTCSNYEVCFIDCKNCSKLNIVVKYHKNIGYIHTSCNNQICIDHYNIGNNISCWYQKNNKKNVDLSPPSTYKWYIIFILCILCFILLAYSTIVISFFITFGVCI